MSNIETTDNVKNANSKNRKIGATISLVNMLTSIVLGLIYTPFVLKKLGQGEYGIYSLASSIVSYLAILDLGFGSTLVRYTSRAKAVDEDDRYINGFFLLFYCLISLISLGIGIVLSLGLGSFFGSSFSQDELVILRKVYFIFLANTALAFPASFFSAIIRTNEKFIFANIMTLISNILRHLFGVLVLLLGYHSVAMALVSLGVSIFAFIINLFCCFKKLHLKIGLKKFDKSFYKEIIFFSAFILINIVVDELYGATDNIILGKVCGTVAVSIYAVGVTFKGYFSKFSMAISSVFLPHVSKLSVKNDGIEKMSNLFVKVGRIQFLLLSYILLGFTIYGREFIKLWVGNGYEDSFYIALLVIIPAIIPLSQNIGISILQALNKHKTRSIMYLCIALFNVGISIPLSYKFAGIGAAMGTAIGNLLGQILFMNYYYHRIGINVKDYWKQVILILALEIPIGGAFLLSLLLPISGWGGLLTKIAIPQIFALPYFYFIVLNKNEKELTLGVLLKPFKKILKTKKNKEA